MFYHCQSGLVCKKVQCFTFNERGYHAAPSLNKQGCFISSHDYVLFITFKINKYNQVSGARVYDLFPPKKLDVNKTKPKDIGTLKEDCSLIQTAVN